MVVEALRKLRRTTKVVSLEGTIFRGEKGKRLGYYLIYGTLQKVAPRRVRPHDLCHTYATFKDC